MANGGTERIVAASPIASAGGRVIVAPFQFYLDGADNIRIEGWNTLTGAVLQVHGRFYKEDGTMQIFGATLPLTADRVRTVVDVPLARGYITNLIVTVTGATPLLGQTFARVSIIRGLTGATIVVGTLLQGYLTGALGLAWPGSPIQQVHEVAGYMRSFVGTDPAVGLPITETVPAGAHWRIFSMQFGLSTDATAGDRQPYIQINDPGGNQYFRVSTVGICPPSSVRSFFAAEMIPDTLTQPVTGTMTAYPHAELSAGSEILIWTDVADPGDDFLSPPRMMVQERLEV